MATTVRGIYRWSLHPESEPYASSLRVEPPQLLLPQGDFGDSAPAPGGGKVLAARRNGAGPVLVDLESAAETPCPHRSPPLERVALDPAGHWAAAGARHAGLAITVWDCVTGQVIRNLAVEGSSCLAASPDGRWLATHEMKQFRLWRTDVWEPWPQSVPADGISEVIPLAFSQDSRVLAIFHRLDGIQLIKVPSCKLIATFKLPSVVALSALSFSSDGTQLAAADATRQVHLWDLRRVRAELKKLNLDWDLPPFSPARGAPSTDKALRQLDAGPFSREDLARAIPPRETNAPPNLIDLTPFYNAPLTANWMGGDPGDDLAELPRGLQQLAGVPFDVRGLIQIGVELWPKGTYSMNSSAEASSQPCVGVEAGNRLRFPAKVESIPIGQSCQRLHFLHAAFVASRAGFGGELGRYVVHYVDGHQAEIPILVGKDLADWCQNAKEESSIPTVAWMGNSTATVPGRPGRSIRLFKMTWDNPSPSIPIAQFDFISSKTTSGAPFLVAVSADLASGSGPAFTHDARPFSRQELAVAIPARQTNAPASLIDLTDYYNAPLTASWHSMPEEQNDLSELPRGLQTLAAVRFDIRGLIQIGAARTPNGACYPSDIRGIPIGQSCRRLHFLHAAIHVADAHAEDRFGSYVVHYADGRQAEIPILFGRDLADWWSEPDEEKMQFVIAWTGNNPAARSSSCTLRLFKTTWENPYPEMAIRHLDFVSDKGAPGAPFLVALTAEP